MTLPNRVHMMRTLGKTIHPPYTLPPSIEAAIAEEIVAPPHKRYRSPSPSSASSLPPPSPLPSPSCKRCSSSSPPPQPLPLSSSPPSDLLPPRK
ncbi:hypothetical protein Tco_0176989, partial [Tanacetum coccineum]